MIVDIIQRQYSMGLHDVDGNLLILGAKVNVRFLQYGPNNNTLHNSGVIMKISHNKPHITVSTNHRVSHFNGLKRFSHSDHKIDFYHFSKTTSGIWIAFQRIKKPGYLEEIMYIEQKK